jgi:hypothetical protein
MFRQPLRNAKERFRLFLSERARRARALRDRLRRQPDRIDPSSRFVSGFCYGYGKREARGLELLKEWLSPEQFAQYDAKSYFEVTGCHRGKRYRISHGTSMNINELDGAGCPVLVGALRRKVNSATLVCFVPTAELPRGHRFSLPPFAGNPTVWSYIRRT